MKKAVILLSGGLDSSTVTAYAKNQGFDCYPISFNYGQKRSIELEAAKKIAAYFGIIHHKIITLPPNMFGASALTDHAIEVPEYSVERAKEIPITYVPARNTLFLSIALGYAETIGAYDIFFGASDIDYSGYPDCRPEFVAAFEKLAEFGNQSRRRRKQIYYPCATIKLIKNRHY